MDTPKLSRPYFIFIHAVAIIWGLVCIFPMVFSFLSSFKNNTQIYNNAFGFPETFSLDNYIFALYRADILRGVFNSFLYATLSTTAVILLAIPVAYSLTRLNIRGAGVIMFYFIAGLTLPVHAMIVPLSIRIADMNLRNSIAGIVLVYIAINFSFAVFVLSGFMKGISSEIDEAATIDGCGVLRLLFGILTPLLFPAIATCFIITFLRVYNDLIFSVVLLSKQELATVSIALMSFKGDQTINFGGTFAGICIAILPLLIVYIAFQKKIEMGLSEGAVKG
ncbi:MAG: carbohydrate ABC transporter permease [Oscillospiraceae bacterium]|nr:carbohydrate ABC transporter permease [Oscillospiraceae bacterium]